MHEPRSDEALMTAYVRDDDQAAFVELVRRYRDMLTTVVRRRVADPEEVRDLVQRAFLQMHRARHRYEAGRPLRPWLYTIAANLSRDFVRLRRHRLEVHLEHESAAPAGRDPVTLTREKDLVRRAIAALPPKQRAVVAMHWFEGLTYREIAQRIGGTPTAIKLHGYRGKKALAELLERERPELRAA